MRSGYVYCFLSNFVISRIEQFRDNPIAIASLTACLFTTGNVPGNAKVTASTMVFGGADWYKALDELNILLFVFN